MLNYLYYLCVLALSLGQFSSISKSGGINIYVFDVLVLVFFFVGFIYLALVKRTFYISRLFMPFVLFSVVAAISLIINSYKYSEREVLSAFFYFLRYVSYLGSGIVLENMKRIKMIGSKDIYKAFILSGVFLSLAGFIQLVVLPDFEVLESSLGWDPHKNRLASTFFDPNFLGVYLVMCLGILFNKHFEGDKLSLVDIAAGVFILLAIILTFSRSTWLMLAVMVLLYGIVKSRVLFILSLFLLFSTYYFIPRVQTRISGITDPADSAHYRLISWRNTLEIIEDNWLFGVGFNAYRYVQKEYGFLDFDTYLDHSGAGSDSSFLFVVATSGVFGLLAFLYGFFQPLYISARSPSGKNMLYILLTVGLFVEAQFINSMFFPQIMFVYYSLLSSDSFVRT
ncbi:O-antigen ligase family protein [Patescibacteria group bacterium]|nr:O-antigen ligase family protein [Patescibacteria group bacterium]